MVGAAGSQIEVGIGGGMAAGAAGGEDRLDVAPKRDLAVRSERACGCERRHHQCHRYPPTVMNWLELHSRSTAKKIHGPFSRIGIALLQTPCLAPAACTSNTRPERGFATSV